MDRSEIMALIDEAYIVRIRRQLHMYPELEFDLPNTLALVRSELAQLGIPFTEKYGRSSIAVSYTHLTGISNPATVWKTPTNSRTPPTPIAITTPA